MSEHVHQRLGIELEMADVDQLRLRARGRITMLHGRADVTITDHRVLRPCCGPFVPTRRAGQVEGTRAGALHCAKWAVESAHSKSASHPRWKELKEAHQVWKDSWFSIEFGVADIKTHVAGSPTPIEDLKIQWTENAVAVAEQLGKEDGWERSSWEQLSVDLIGIDTPHVTDENETG
jgi:hypothetical protein